MANRPRSVRRLALISMLVSFSSFLVLLPAPSAEAFTNNVSRVGMANFALNWSTCSVVADGPLYCWSPGIGKDPEPKYGAAYAIYPKGSDCTDFVSTSLHLGGGLSMDSTYWYTKSTWYGLVSRTTTWSVVNSFVSYMRYGRGITYQTWNSPASSVNDADLADVILYNFGGGFDHLAIETGFGQTTWRDKLGHSHSFDGDLVSQHSNARRNSPWNLGYLIETDPTKRAYMRQQGFYVIHWATGYGGW